MKKFREFVGRLALVILFIGIVALIFSGVDIMELVIWGGFVFIGYMAIDFLLETFDDSE